MRVRHMGRRKELVRARRMVGDCWVGDSGEQLDVALPRFHACEYSQECQVWRS
jgi:hypothetical protein